MFGIYRETLTCTNMKNHVDYFPCCLWGLSCGISGPRMNGQSRLERHLAGYESSSTVMSSELETTSFCDSEDDDTMSR